MLQNFEKIKDGLLCRLQVDKTKLRVFRIFQPGFDLPMRYCTLISKENEVLLIIYHTSMQKNAFNMTYVNLNFTDNHSTRLCEAPKIVTVPFGPRITVS
jgi:hypothetical protein